MSINRVIIPPVIPFFLPLMTCQYQLKDLILVLSFLKLSAMINQEMKDILQDQADIFQDTYF